MWMAQQLIRQLQFLCILLRWSRYKPVLMLLWTMAWWQLLSPSTLLHGYHHAATLTYHNKQPSLYCVPNY
jgi:hypothetical protein